MNTSRLARLADFIESVPVDRMTTKSWRYDNSVVTFPLAVSDEDLVNNYPTAACAIGWACLIPEFNEAGFEWSKVMPVYITDDYTRSGWGAVKEFFGLTNSQSYDMFSWMAYDGEVSGDDVARRVRKLVAANK